MITCLLLFQILADKEKEVPLFLRLVQILIFLINKYPLFLSNLFLHKKYMAYHEIELRYQVHQELRLLFLLVSNNLFTFLFRIMRNFVSVFTQKLIKRKSTIRPKLGSDLSAICSSLFDLL